MSIRSGQNIKKEGADTPIDTPLTGRRYARRAGDIRQPEASSSIWLVSFTDVMALMLTFFVLLFSMTEPAKQDWSEMTAALHSEFKRFHGAAQDRGTVDEINIDRINFDQALSIPYLHMLMERIVQESRFLQQASLISMNDRLVISLPQDVLFEVGEAGIREEGARALYALGGVLTRVRNKVEVVGHADPRPFRGDDGAFRSNWDLSLARAATVAGILESVGYSRDVTLRGASSGRYRDLSGIADEDRRMDLSRRVDVVILNHDGRRQNVAFGNFQN